MYRMKNRKFRQIIAEKHCELCQLVIGKKSHILSTGCQKYCKFWQLLVEWEKNNKFHEFVMEENRKFCQNFIENKNCKYCLLMARLFSLLEKFPRCTSIMYINKTVFILSCQLNWAY